jgi:hypothetical protein
MFAMLAAKTGKTAGNANYYGTTKCKKKGGKIKPI